MFKRVLFGLCVVVFALIISFSLCKSDGLLVAEGEVTNALNKHEKNTIIIDAGHGGLTNATD